MQLRKSNDDVVCKIYDTSRNSKPVATGCPTSGTFKEILWNTQSDGSWKEVARRTVTLNGGGDGGGDRTHTGGQNAQHMQLRFNNNVVCKIYDTSRNSKPVATGCPTKAGDYREFLWNTASDGSWKQVSIRTVTIGDDGPQPTPPPPPPPSGERTHTGGQNAQHMQLRFNNNVVCKIYDTSRNSKPVATGCPTKPGDYREFLWNTASDGSWKQVSIRTVTISDDGGPQPTPPPPPPPPSGERTHTGGQNAQHMQLRFNNNVVCKIYDTSRNSKPVATGCPTKAGDYREFLWNTASDGSWTQVNIRTVTISDDGGPQPTPPPPPPSGERTHTGVQNAQHMQLRFNNNVVCKVYNTSRNSKPVASGCPTKAGDYREFLWNTASDGSWTQVNIRTVTIGDDGSDGGDGGLERTTVRSPGGPYKIDLPNNNAWYEVRDLNRNSRIVCAGQGLGECNLPVSKYKVLRELDNKIIEIISDLIKSYALTSALGEMRNTNPRFDSSRALYNTRSDALSLTNPSLTKPVSGEGDEGEHSGLTSTNDRSQIGHANFRVSCQYSHFNYDDAILASGDVHGAHLHMYFGNTKANAFSEADAPNDRKPGSMKDSGSGTCHGFELNRSAYWMPALLDGEGNAVVPVDIIAYYKTKDATKLHREGMPQGLQMIGGALKPEWPFDLEPAHKTPDLFWSCGKTGTVRNQQARIPAGNKKCNRGEYINATISFPQCWDGVNLQNDDLSHVFKIKEEGADKAECPRSHPHRMPQLSILVYWEQPADRDTSKWRLSSDSEARGDVPGGSLHADWIGGWSNAAMAAWMGGCMLPQDGTSGNNCTYGQTGTKNRLLRLNDFEFVYDGAKYLPYPKKSDYLD